MNMFKNLISRSKSQDSESTRSEQSGELSNIRSKFDKMIENFWGAEPSDLWTDRWGCEVQDGEDSLMIRAEAPGFEPEEINVQLCGNRLVVEAEHKSEGGNGNGKFSQYGKLYRSITVPCGVEADKVEASYKNGVLQVNLPKDKASCAKRIAVAAK